MSTEINLINKIVVLDEGTILTSDATSLNFTGPGVTATSINGDVTIDITGGGGGSVTDVTASTPLFSTGGATPDISIQQASALQDGYLSALDWTNFNSKVSSSLLGANNGVATLDSGGKVPVTQLPNSIMDYKGTYDIITNTPTLVNGTGNAGDVYINTAAGTRDFGAGPITVAIGDWLVYNGSTWEKSINSNAVASVNGQTGIVTLGVADIPGAIGGSGTINYLSKFTASGTLGDSAVFESGGKVGINVVPSVGSSTFNVKAIAVPSAGESIASFAVSDSSASFSIQNAANTDSLFIPSLVGNQAPGINQIALNLTGYINSADDTGTTPIMSFRSALTSLAPSTTRPAFDFRNWATTLMTIAANGNVGIGTATPTKKLEVSADILVNTITIGLGSGSISSNTALGFQALNANTTGADSVVIGYQAGVSNTTASRNVVIGYQAQYSGTTGSADNIAIGYKALYTNTNAWSNTALGSFAATANTTGNNLVAVGKSALAANTTGYQNTAVGSSALSSNTTGNNNVAVGKGTLSASTTGSGNTAVGNGALIFNTTGSGNASFALESLSNNTTGYNNAAYGSTALLYNTTGYRNTAIGNSALYSNITGQSNVSLGYEAGAWTAGGSVLFPNNTPQQSVFLGASTKSLNATDTNQIVIGYNVTGNGTNTTTIGLQGTTTDTWLAGYLHVNSAYKLPNVDGTNGQILQTDGAGNATWQNSSGGGGTVTSVGLSMPSAFSVASSPITGAGTIAVTGAGTTSDYIRGDGSLAAFPTGLPTSEIIQDVKLGEAIPTGYAVYVFTADGTNIIVKKASNDTEATSSKTLGLLVAGGALNFQTTVLTNGILSGLNTSTATIGDAVWLGTGGQLLYGLINKPYAPAHLVYIGVVTRVNGSNGEIFVSVQNGFELDELHNVDARNPLNNDGIFYNTTTSLWEHKSIATVLGYTPVAGSGTINYLSKFTAAGTIGDSAVFETAGNVGIGTITPSASLHVNNIGTGNSFLVEDATNPDATPFVVDTNGNVGMGTLTPATVLHVKANPSSTQTATIRIESDSVLANSSIAYYSGGINRWEVGTGISAGAPYEIYDRVAGQTRFQITTGGTALFSNGDVTISTIANATIDTDKFLVSDSGVVKYRTGTEVLSDIGGISLSSLSANTPLSYDSGTGAFSIQVATTAQNGYLSFADWNTFSGKVGGSGTANYVSKFTASGTIGNSLIQDNGTTLAIGAAPTVNSMFSVTGNAGALYGVSGRSIKANGYGGDFLGANGIKGTGGGSGGAGSAIGGEFYAYDNALNIGVYGVAGIDSYGATTNIGGKFIALDATNNYAVQLVDGTEGLGKFLKCVDGTFGYANWATMSVADTGLTLTTTGSGASTLVGNTLNIPQTSNFDYGLSYAMASQNILL